MTKPDDKAPTKEHLGLMSRDLPFMVRALQSLLRPEGEKIRTALDIEAGTIGVLSIIWLNPGISQNDLAKSIVLKKSAVTALVQKLEDRGLILRQRNPKDRRINDLTLTTDGHALIAKIRVETQTLNDRIFAGIDHAEREQFFATLEKVVENLSSTGGTAP